MKSLIASSLLLLCYLPGVSACNSESVKPPQTKPVQTMSANESLIQVEAEGTEAIRRLQLKLSEKGYYDGPIDGIMTPELRKAAKGELRDRL